MANPSQEICKIRKACSLKKKKKKDNLSQLCEHLVSGFLNIQNRRR